MPSHQQLKVHSNGSHLHWYCNHDENIFLKWFLQIKCFLHLGPPQVKRYCLQMSLVHWNHLIMRMKRMPIQVIKSFSFTMPPKLHTAQQCALLNKVLFCEKPYYLLSCCLLYTSDAADDTPCVDLGGRRIIKNYCLSVVAITASVSFSSARITLKSQMSTRRKMYWNITEYLLLLFKSTIF